MAHHTQEQVAEMTNEQNPKTYVKDGVSLFFYWLTAEMCQRQASFFFFLSSGYNLAVIALQMTGRMPNIKEWISSIYIHSRSTIMVSMWSGSLWAVISPYAQFPDMGPHMDSQLTQPTKVIIKRLLLKHFWMDRNTILQLRPRVTSPTQSRQH